MNIIESMEYKYPIEKLKRSLGFGILYLNFLHFLRQKKMFWKRIIGEGVHFHL